MGLIHMVWTEYANHSDLTATFWYEDAALAFARAQSRRWGRATMVRHFPGRRTAVTYRNGRRVPEGKK